MRTDKARFIVTILKDAPIREWSWSVQFTPEGGREKRAASGLAADRKLAIEEAMKQAVVLAQDPPERKSAA